MIFNLIIYNWYDVYMFRDKVLARLEASDARCGDDNARGRGSRRRVGYSQTSGRDRTDRVNDRSDAPETSHFQPGNDARAP